MYMEVNKVTVTPVVVGAVGVILGMFEIYIRKLDVKIAMEIIQKAALLGTAILLRRFGLFRDKGREALRPLVTCCYSLSRTGLTKILPKN